MLIDELPRQGEWLFRWRSYVPLALLPFALLVLAQRREPWCDSIAIERAYEWGCFVVSLSGLLVRGVALGFAQSGSSGRNTRQQIADHLNTSGLYSVCRHPLYLGNILIVLGVLLFTKSLTLALAGLLFYLLFYERIIAVEERFLEGKFGKEFLTWAARTPALWPRSGRWQAPGIPFSWRAAVKGEFYGLTAVTVAMTALRTLETRFTLGAWTADPVWVPVSIAVVIVFVILRFIRKYTSFFEPRTVRAEN